MMKKLLISYIFYVKEEKIVQNVTDLYLFIESRKMFRKLLEMLLNLHFHGNVDKTIENVSYFYIFM